jgi:hypothetical protein
MATRRAARLRPPSETQVALSGTDSKFTGSLLEISPYGLSVKSSQKVEIGTVLRLAIAVGGDFIRAAAIVRTIRPDGFAMEFLSMTTMDRQTMRRLYLKLEIATRST